MGNFRCLGLSHVMIAEIFIAHTIGDALLSVFSGMALPSLFLCNLSTGSLSLAI